MSDFIRAEHLKFVKVTVEEGSEVIGSDRFKGVRGILKNVKLSVT